MQDALSGNYSYVLYMLCGVLSPYDYPYLLDVPYTTPELARQVVYTVDSVPVYRDMSASSIVRVYRAIRAGIRAERSTRGGHGWVYVALDVADGLLWRLGRAADVGGYTSTSFQGVDYSGGVYTAGLEEARREQAMIDALDLRGRQAEVLQYLRRGMNQSDIARKFGVSQQAINALVAKIRKRAAALGFTPTAAVEKSLKDKPVCPEVNCEPIIIREHMEKRLAAYHEKVLRDMRRRYAPKAKPDTRPIHYLYEREIAEREAANAAAAEAARQAKILPEAEQEKIRRKNAAAIAAAADVGGVFDWIPGLHC